MAIYNTTRPTPVGYHSIKDSVSKSDIKQHPLHTIPPQTVATKRYSPLGPTRKAKR